MVIEYKKILVRELFFDCPMGNARKSCMTRIVRKMPLEKRHAILDKMQEEELDFLLKNHKECQFNRLIEQEKTGKADWN